MSVPAVVPVRSNQDPSHNQSLKIYFSSHLKPPKNILRRLIPAAHTFHMHVSFLFFEGQGSVSYAVTESSRKMPWSDRETQALLEVWGEDHVQLSLRGCLKNRHVFEYISRRMTTQGFIRTAEQCHTRIKRLKASFHHDK